MLLFWYSTIILLHWYLPLWHTDASLHLLLLSTCCHAGALWSTYRLERKSNGTVCIRILILPFHVYIRHKFNVSHCPLTDISVKVSPNSKDGNGYSLGRDEVAGVFPMYNSPRSEAGINELCSQAIPFITIFTQRYATVRHGKIYLTIPSLQWWASHVSNASMISFEANSPFQKSLSHIHAHHSWLLIVVLAHA